MEEIGRTYEKQFLPWTKQVSTHKAAYEDEGNSARKITLSDLKETRKNLNNNKTPGHDQIWPIQLKKLPVNATQEIQFIYNTAILTGHYSTKLKEIEKGRSSSESTGRGKKKTRLGTIDPYLYCQQ